MQLGDKAKDKVTGLEGILTGHAKWITGCESWIITQRVQKDGKVPDTVWVDAMRIEVIEVGAVQIPRLPDDVPAAG